MPQETPTEADLLALSPALRDMVGNSRPSLQLPRPCTLTSMETISVPQPVPHCRSWRHTAPQTRPSRTTGPLTDEAGLFLPSPNGSDAGLLETAALDQQRQIAVMVSATRVGRVLALTGCSDTSKLRVMTIATREPATDRSTSRRSSSNSYRQTTGLDPAFARKLTLACRCSLEGQNTFPFDQNSTRPPLLQQGRPGERNKIENRRNW